MTESSQLDAVLSHVDATLDESLERLLALVSIPSISTDPRFAADCRRAAAWLSNELNDLGLDASVRETSGHPMVLGHSTSDASRHVLFYGHYDVQPVDPLALWQMPPFEAKLVNEPAGRAVIHGRGASDDKGQLLTFVEACRAFIAVTGALPVRVSMLFEGEEEAGSHSLGPFLDHAAEELRADVVLVCDTDMWNRETPAITTMLRGLVGEEVEISASNRDLHSGMFGGAARNPLQVLSEVIASLRHPDGSVAIQGFYQGVEAPSPEQRRQWQQLGFSEGAFLGEIGLSVPAGEQEFSVLEQIWARPTCEINGVVGGYTSEGFKTVIPAKASAKISFRLVGGQDPAQIREAFRAHVRARMPTDCSVAFREHGASPAQVVALDSAFLRQAAKALADEWGQDAALTGSGGSIPIVGEFKRRLNLDTLLIGFAQLDDNIHSPNEKYDLASFHKGIRSWVRILAAFAQRP